MNIRKHLVRANRCMGRVLMLSKEEVREAEKVLRNRNTGSYLEIKQ